MSPEMTNIAVLYVHHSRTGLGQAVACTLCLLPGPLTGQCCSVNCCNRLLTPASTGHATATCSTNCSGSTPSTPSTQRHTARMARTRSQAPSATGPSRTRSGKPFKEPALEQSVEPKSRLPSRRRRRVQQSLADDAVPATEPCWNDLPAAIWGEFVARLDLSSFLALRLVSRQLKAAVTDARPQTSVRAKCGVRDLRGLSSAFPAATRARVETNEYAGICRRGGRVDPHSTCTQKRPVCS